MALPSASTAAKRADKAPPRAISLQVATTSPKPRPRRISCGFRRGQREDGRGRSTPVASSVPSCSRPSRASPAGGRRSGARPWRPLRATAISFAGREEGCSAGAEL